VTIAGKRHVLGPDRTTAEQEFHKLMAQPRQKKVSANSVVAILDTFLE
jgi:hypothetical protein